MDKSSDKITRQSRCRDNSEPYMFRQIQQLEPVLKAANCTTTLNRDNKNDETSEK